MKTRRLLCFSHLILLARGRAIPRPAARLDDGKTAPETGQHPKNHDGEYIFPGVEKGDALFRQAGIGQISFPIDPAQWTPDKLVPPEFVNVPLDDKTPEDFGYHFDDDDDDDFEPSPLPPPPPPIEDEDEDDNDEGAYDGDAYDDKDLPDGLRSENYPHGSSERPYPDNQPQEEYTPPPPVADAPISVDETEPVLLDPPTTTTTTTSEDPAVTKTLTVDFLPPTTTMTMSYDTKQTHSPDYLSQAALDELSYSAAGADEPVDTSSPSAAVEDSGTEKAPMDLNSGSVPASESASGEPELEEVETALGSEVPSEDAPSTVVTTENAPPKYPDESAESPSSNAVDVRPEQRYPDPGRHDVTTKEGTATFTNMGEGYIEDLADGLFPGIFSGSGDDDFGDFDDNIGDYNSGYDSGYDSVDGYLRQSKQKGGSSSEMPLQHAHASDPERAFDVPPMLGVPPVRSAQGFQVPEIDGDTFSTPLFPPTPPFDDRRPPPEIGLDTPPPAYRPAGVDAETPQSTVREEPQEPTRSSEAHVVDKNTEQTPETTRTPSSSTTSEPTKISTSEAPTLSISEPAIVVATYDSSLASKATLAFAPSALTASGGDSPSSPVIIATPASTTITTPHVRPPSVTTPAIATPTVRPSTASEPSLTLTISDIDVPASGVSSGSVIAVKTSSLATPAFDDRLSIFTESAQPLTVTMFDNSGKLVTSVLPVLSTVPPPTPPEPTRKPESTLFVATGAAPETTSTPIQESESPTTTTGSIVGANPATTSETTAHGSALLIRLGPATEAQPGWTKVPAAATLRPMIQGNLASIRTPQKDALAFINYLIHKGSEQGIPVHYVKHSVRPGSRKIVSSAVNGAVVHKRDEILTPADSDVAPTPTNDQARPISAKEPTPGNTEYDTPMSLEYDAFLPPYPEAEPDETLDDDDGGGGTESDLSCAENAPPWELFKASANPDEEYQVRSGARAITDEDGKVTAIEELEEWRQRCEKSGRRGRRLELDNVEAKPLFDIGVAELSNQYREQSKLGQPSQDEDPDPVWSEWSEWEVEPAQPSSGEWKSGSGR